MADKEINLNLRATDKASKPVEGLADSVDKLDGREANVNLTATDKASDDVRALMSRIEGLTNEQQKIVLQVEKEKAERDLKSTLLLIGRVDDAEALAKLDVDKVAAETKLTAVKGEIDKVDGRIATATIDAKDDTADEVASAKGELNKIPKTVNTTIDADQGSGLTNILGSIDAIPTKITSGMDTLSAGAGKAGAIGLAVTAMAGLVTQAANWGAEVAEVSQLTGDSTEDVSAFLTIWKNAGFEKGDLLDIVAQMVGVLADSPALAEELGIKLDGTMTPLEMLKAAIEGLNSDQLTANERILKGSQLFGEEGVRQVNSLVTQIGGDLQGAIDDVAESQILSQAEVDKALELKMQFAEISATIQAMTGQLGQVLIPPLTEALDLVGQIEEANRHQRI